MAKTARDAYRHAKVLGEFFQGVHRVGGEVVEDFLRVRKERRYLRQSLARLVARGFLKKEGNALSPTARGRALFRRYAVAPPAFAELPVQGKWYLLSFDIPVRRTSARVALTRLLRARRFIPFQRSVWIGPHRLAADVWEFIVDEHLAAFCSPMIVEIVEGGEELKRQFKDERSRVARNQA